MNYSLLGLTGYNSVWAVCFHPFLFSVQICKILFVQKVLESIKIAIGRKFKTVIDIKSANEYFSGE
jgi:hypothetical protein